MNEARLSTAERQEEEGVSKAERGRRSLECITNDLRPTQGGVRGHTY